MIDDDEPGDEMLEVIRKLTPLCKGAHPEKLKGVLAYISAVADAAYWDKKFFGDGRGIYTPAQGLKQVGKIERATARMRDTFKEIDPILRKVMFSRALKDELDRVEGELVKLRDHWESQKTRAPAAKVDQDKNSKTARDAYLRDSLDRLYRDFKDITGERPNNTTNPDTGRADGNFADLARVVFEPLEKKIGKLTDYHLLKAHARNAKKTPQRRSLICPKNGTKHNK